MLGFVNNALGAKRMRVFAVLLVLGALGYGAAGASPNFPAGAEAAEHTFLGQLDSYWQGWVKEQARTMVSSGRITEDHARSLAQGARMTAGADVNVVSFLLLMQAARDADADLQATMNRSIQARTEQDELSQIAHNKAPADHRRFPWLVLDETHDKSTKSAKAWSSMQNT